MSFCEWIKNCFGVNHETRTVSAGAAVAGAGVAASVSAANATDARAKISTIKIVDDLSILLEKIEFGAPVVG